MLVRSLRTFFPLRPPAYTLAIPKSTSPPSAALIAPPTTIYSETELYRTVPYSPPSSSPTPPFPILRNP